MIYTDGRPTIVSQGVSAPRSNAQATADTELLATPEFIHRLDGLACERRPRSTTRTPAARVQASR